MKQLISNENYLLIRDHCKRLIRNCSINDYLPHSRGRFDSMAVMDLTMF